MGGAQGRLVRAKASPEARLSGRAAEASPETRKSEFEVELTFRLKGASDERRGEFASELTFRSLRAARRSEPLTNWVGRPYLRAQLGAARAAEAAPGTWASRKTESIGDARLRIV